MKDRERERDIQSTTYSDGGGLAKPNNIVHTKSKHLEEWFKTEYTNLSTQVQTSWVVHPCTNAAAPGRTREVHSARLQYNLLSTVDAVVSETKEFAI